MRRSRRVAAVAAEHGGASAVADDTVPAADTNLRATMPIWDTVVNQLAMPPTRRVTFADVPVSESPIGSAPPSPKAPPNTSPKAPPPPLPPIQKPVKAAPAYLQRSPTSDGPEQARPKAAELPSAVADAIGSHVDSLAEQQVAKRLDTLSDAVHGLRQELRGRQGSGGNNLSSGADSMAEIVPPTKAPAADQSQAALAAPPRPLSPPVKAPPVPVKAPPVPQPQGT